MLILLALACSGTPAGDDSAGTVDFSGGDSASGETIFGSTCVNCHGADGKLGTEINGTPAADLTVRVPADDDARLADQIQAGGAVAMPAQGLDNTETADVIAYLRVTFP